MSYKDKTVIISGASRGIGLSIAKALAKDGANIVLAAKTSEPHPILPGTLYTAAEEVESAGGNALPIVCDVRDESQIDNVVKEAINKFKKIDALVLNASALSLQGTLETPIKKFDLMSNINQRGTFLMGRACIPHLIQSDNPHILTISPPLDFADHWWGKYLPWTMMKYSMSLCVLAWSQEFSKSGLAANALWPKTAISTAATKMLGDAVFKQSRKPEIMADAAYWVLTQDANSCNGNYFLDESVLKDIGIKDFDVYANDPSTPPLTDFLVDP
ncbi:MAG: short chain dehydrogenase [Gammaproteobacteria bacterium TMED78]|nr:MAG: short chain dehydrogenase [Gammaproteobacteria bacterium TMED78]|tara:strand:+ start:25236 stop:26054 length:819 start_codon:yes stop_codon:yes gene_type:complete